ncbi:hypothetical protein GALMADRAFT_217693 [Galerina marginata CBS 339.88]|uniref:Uncharacterized protein n=1 Tax=Galerina marginata (strain CBS 339.88) TaxID=685588 RepID=A0A067S2L7_GALM3|nr:hypothetical protein GALMADRAFT_217693 [Galerina marginata CBS 339.88]
MLEFPEHMRIPDTTQVDVAIPGWHINGHGEKCRTNFNLAYMEGAGRTVGEDIETTWAGTNSLAPSVREMAPAARHDTLNDHWNGWNFRKVVGFRTLFFKRFNDAYNMSAKQTGVFNQLSTTFPPATIKKWESVITTWEANPKARNPYAEPASTTTLQDVRLALAKEEAAEVALGNLPRHKMSLSAFLIAGFELEDSQYLIRREASQMKGNKTSKQLADLQEKRNALHRLLQNWREAQLVYTPHVALLLSRPPSAPNTTTPLPSSSTLSPSEALPENMPLFLPSSLPVHIRALPELKAICQLERRLREAQAEDALAEVRRQRRVIQGLWLFKRLNVSGTGNRPNTKMITLYKCFNKKTERAAEKYRSAWRALCVLNPGGSWSTRFKELKKEDISGPGKDADDTSNSRYLPSWILLVPREEMRRVIVYLRWKADWWRERSALRGHLDTSILSGVSGYAHKQASICLRIAERCAVHWLPQLENKGLKPVWAADYAHLVNRVSVSETGVDDTERSEDVVLELDGECEDEDSIDVEGYEDGINVEADVDDDDDFDFGD